MSTEIGSISGKTEFISDYHKKEVGYKNNTLSLVSFSGGKERGKCIQLTLDKDHIQLRKETAMKLRDFLIQFLDDIPDMSDENIFL